MRSLLFLVHIITILGSATVSSASPNVPVGFSTYFTSTECPEGWRQLDETRGRLIVSTANPNNAGITVNNPFTVTSSGEPNDITHTHDYSALVTIPALGIAAIAGCCDHAGAEHGSYPVVGTSENSNSGYPFTQLLMCTYFGNEKNNSSSVVPTVAYGTVGFFNPGGESSSCPANWVPMHSSEGRILLPGYKNQGGEVRNDRPALASGEDRMHNHTYSIPIHLNEMSFVGAGRCCDENNGKFETVSFANGTTVSSSSNLPYIQLLTCVSQVESFNQTLPHGARTFTSISCPPQYQVATDNSGRMLVSLPEGGNPGATFGGNSIPPQEISVLKRLTPGQFVNDDHKRTKAAPIYQQTSSQQQEEQITHSHPISGSVSIPSSSTTLVDGCCDHGYAQEGKYAYLAESDLAGVGLPYSMLPMCEYVGERERK